MKTKVKKLPAFTRNHLFAIVIGFILTLILSMAHVFIAIAIQSQIAHTFSIDDFRNAQFQQPYFTLLWLNRISRFIIPVLSGVIGGFIVKNKGWLYGSYLGLFTNLLFVLFYIIVAFLPDSLLFGERFNALPAEFIKNSHTALVQRIFTSILYVPFSTLMTGFGGFLGQKIYMSTKLKKS